MENEITESIGPMTEKALEWADKLEAAVVDVAPYAWELALMTARVEAAQVVVHGLIGVAVLIAGSLWASWAFRKAKKEEDYYFQVIFAVVLVIVGGMQMLFNLFNTIAWAGIFYPEIWLVHKLM